MTFKINFMSDDEGYKAKELIENLSFGLMPFINYGIDGMTTTNQDSLVINPDISTSTNALIEGLTDSQSAIFSFVLDEHNDSVINTDIWTTAVSGTGSGSNTVTEDTTKMRATANSYDGQLSATAISDGTSGYDALSFSGNSELIVKFDLFVDGGDDTPGVDTEAAFQISNGSTHVIIDNQKAADGSKSGVYKLVFNKDVQEVRVWKDDSEMGGSPFDISSVTTNWYIRILANAAEGSGTPGDADTATIDIYYEGYLDGTSGTGVVTTTSTSLDKKSDNAILKLVSNQNDVSSFTLKVSSNNGVDYNIVPNKELSKITYISDTAVLRFEYTLNTTIDVTSPSLVEHQLDYGAFFG